MNKKVRMIIINTVKRNKNKKIRNKYFGNFLTAGPRGFIQSLTSNTDLHGCIIFDEFICKYPILIRTRKESISY